MCVEEMPYGKAKAVRYALAAVKGAWGVRVHEVGPTLEALEVVRAWSEAGGRG